MTTEEQNRVGEEVLAEYQKSKKDLAFARIALSMVGERLEAFATGLKEFAKGDNSFDIPIWDNGFGRIPQLLDELTEARKRYAVSCSRIDLIFGEVFIKHEVPHKQEFNIWHKKKD